MIMKLIRKRRMVTGYKKESAEQSRAKPRPSNYLEPIEICTDTVINFKSLQYWHSDNTSAEVRKKIKGAELRE